MPFGPLPYDVGPGTALAFGVTPASLPSWILQQTSLTLVTGGAFRFSLSRNGTPVVSLPATVGTSPTYQAQSDTFVALYYNFVGGEFGTQTGTYWVSLQLTLSNGSTVDVEPDTLSVTTPWGQV